MISRRYSLADLRACVDKNDTEFFRRNFNGKVVLFGSALDIEDRKLTSKRFATTPAGASAERCALPALPPPPFARSTIDGVNIHATAVNNLLRHEAVTELGRLPTGFISAVFGLLASLAALVFAPATACLSYFALAVAWAAGATVAFNKDLALPLLSRSRPVFWRLPP